jgi:hypothetical protein
MQGATRQDREHEQPRDVEQADYVNLAVVNDKYNVGKEVRIIKYDVWQNVNAYILGRGGTVISCV